MSTPWSVIQLWNQSFDARPQKKFDPRGYIYASEVGTSYLDLYLKMLGTEPSNPYLPRTLRKFEAGNLAEWVLRFVLSRCGVLKNTQIRSKYQLDGCVPVSGRLDFIAGGYLDFSQAEKDISSLNLPEFFDFTSRKMVEYLKSKYEGIELDEYILELKAVSTFVFDRNERQGHGTAHQECQLFHYVKGLKKDGRLIYMCKDDLRLQEYPVIEEPRLEELYSKFVHEISDFYYQRIIPPHDPEIEFDRVACSFKKNWKVEYSPYLTLRYGYAQPEDYREKWESFCKKANYAYQRCVQGKNITDGNKETIRAVRQYFPEWDDLVDLGKIKGVIPEEETVN